MEYFLLAVAGLLAGLLGGLLGLGGSSIMLPAMVLILGSTDAAGHEQIHQYMAAAMIVNFLLIWPSVFAHLRNKAVWKSVWIYLSASAMAGIIIGVQASYLFKGDAAMYLRWAVGAFFVYVAIHNAYRLTHKDRLDGLSREQVEKKPAWRKIVVGLPMGVIAGLLGIGGGSLAVPGQQILLKMPLRNSIATSAATIATISWLGAVLKNAQISSYGGTVVESLRLTLCLAPTAMIGSWMGGHLTHTLPLRAVRIAFIILLAASAWKMFAG